MDFNALTNMLNIYRFYSYFCAFLIIGAWDKIVFESCTVDFIRCTVDFYSIYWFNSI